MTTVDTSCVAYLLTIARARDLLCAALPSISDAARVHPGANGVLDAAYGQIVDFTTMIEQSIARGEVPRDVAEMYGWVTKE